MNFLKIDGFGRTHADEAPYHVYILTHVSGRYQILECEHTLNGTQIFGGHVPLCSQMLWRGLRGSDSPLKPEILAYPL